MISNGRPSSTGGRASKVTGHSWPLPKTPDIVIVAPTTGGSAYDDPSTAGFTSASRCPADACCAGNPITGTSASMARPIFRHRFAIEQTIIPRHTVRDEAVNDHE